MNDRRAVFLDRDGVINRLAILDFRLAICPGGSLDES